MPYFLIPTGWLVGAFFLIGLWRFLYRTTCDWPIEPLWSLRGISRAALRALPVALVFAPGIYGIGMVVLPLPAFLALPTLLLAAPHEEPLSEGNITELQGMISFAMRSLLLGWAMAFAFCLARQQAKIRGNQRLIDREHMRSRFGAAAPTK